jgi:DnaK suppressor protein
LSETVCDHHAWSCRKALAAGKVEPDVSTPARLRALHVAAVAQVADLAAQHAEVVAASVGSNADDEHDPEGATIAFERQQVLALLAQAQATVERVEAAQAREAAGTYGRCERCGEPIGAARLDALPAAARCVACAALA